MLKLTELSKIAYKQLLVDLKDDLKKINTKNDITSHSLILEKLLISVEISNREEIVLCGINFVKYFLKKKFPTLSFRIYFKDGQYLKKNSKIMRINGDCKKIFLIERSLLNLVQHLSGIATFTKKIVKITNKKTRILDTRKTLPGLRKLQKYATSIGGAINHRMGLYDEILIKDNHIKVLGGIDKTISLLNKKNIKKFKIECENYEDVTKAIRAGASYILLDNMKPEEIKKCIKLKQKSNSYTKFEITGGINLNNIKKYYLLGADYISIGKITNSAKSVDIGLDII
ncbi:MAG: nicotinate-nucleotide diphosphorylase (carboxylating) [Rickettsiales bacterium]|nr:nicotinate-nucleotide diphosphorylase (carboxylating) [Rickettsiales bacterium]